MWPDAGSLWVFTLFFDTLSGKYNDYNLEFIMAFPYFSALDYMIKYILLLSKILPKHEA